MMLYNQNYLSFVSDRISNNAIKLYEFDKKLNLSYTYSYDKLIHYCKFEQVPVPVMSR